MGNGIFKLSNLKKTIYYFQKNGLQSTWYAARERMEEKKKETYFYRAPSRDELEKQKNGQEDIKISIVVPTYNTDCRYFMEMVDSVRAQSYSNWELVIADVSRSKEILHSIVNGYADERIRYIPITRNKGISANTNVGLEHATGDYIGLLDHDDLLTPDALYEMAKAIHANRDGMVFYSDEDKTDMDTEFFYEPHRKMDFNYDLILSNNYICHFMVMQAELLKELRLRPEYDGAQDYDVVLRALDRVRDGKIAVSDTEMQSKIIHIPRVLYHWRCHSGSTAENPASKRYAYEAGKAALTDYLARNQIPGKVGHMKHLGFYRITFADPIWDSRADIGIIGGTLTRGNKIAGGCMEADGSVRYEGLDIHYTGYMHRAVLRQEASLVDMRCALLRPECIPMLQEALKELLGDAYDEAQFDGLKASSKEVPDLGRLPALADKDAQWWAKLNQMVCEKVRKEGYLIVWEPMLNYNLARK